MRAINRFHVIDLIRRDGPIARVEIAERTELSRATVSAITGDLLESGLIGIVTVAASEGGARGRPRVLLEMRGGACHVVGVKLATHRIGVTVTDARGEPLGAAAMPVRLARQPPGVIADLVEDGVRQCVADAGLRLSDIGGVGIGLPGVIDAAAGVSHWSPVLGARPVPFAAEIAARLGVPVLIESDADMVALAEHWFGPGRGPSTLMVVTIEDGIGMGLVLDGRIHRGARGIGPEFGHVKVEPLGLPCRCGGRGCLDAHASGWGILRQALGEAAAETPEAAAGRDAGQGPTARSGTRRRAARSGTRAGAPPGARGGAGRAGRAGPARGRGRRAPGRAVPPRRRAAGAGARQRGQHAEPVPPAGLGRGAVRRRPAARAADGGAGGGRDAGPARGHRDRVPALGRRHGRARRRGDRAAPHLRITLGGPQGHAQGHGPRGAARAGPRRRGPVAEEDAVQPVSIGLIGCGHISAAYLTAAPLFPELRVAAVADLDEGRARARADEFGLRATTIDALLADPAIEVVLNLTTPAAHVPVGLDAIRHGKHVHGEKPLATTAAEGRRLLDAADAAGLRVGCAPDTFLGGAHQSARALLDAGAIGTVLSGTAFMLNHGHEHWHHNPDFYYAAGGGPMLDMGPYYLTNLVNLLGPVASVTGVATTGFPERTIGGGPRGGEVVPVGVATHVSGLLRFAGGAVVSVTTSFDVWQHRHGNMELYGTEGSMVVPDPNRFGGTVSLAKRREPWADMPLTHGFAHGNFRILGLADMARAIRSGRPHRCEGRMALHVLEVMEAFGRSSEAGRTIAIESRCERPAPLPPRTDLGALD